MAMGNKSIDDTGKSREEGVLRGVIFQLQLTDSTRT